MDGKPIVVIATGLETPSANRKTGQVIQTYILHQDDLPTEIVKADRDAATCGNCPLKKYICYVDLRGVNNVWRSWKKGIYPPVNSQVLSRISKRSKRLRLGTYGDPAAAPFEAWQPILDACSGHTGYTHQWLICDPRWKDWIMASVESRWQAELAWVAGWKTYRIMPSDDSPTEGEVICPHTLDELMTCEMCGMCDGRTQSIATPVHGLPNKVRHFNKGHKASA